MIEIKLDFGNGRVEDIKFEEVPIEELATTEEGKWVSIGKKYEAPLISTALGKFVDYHYDSGYLSLRVEQQDKRISGVEYCYSERFIPIGETFWREVE